MYPTKLILILQYVISLFNVNNYTVFSPQAPKDGCADKLQFQIKQFFMFIRWSKYIELWGNSNNQNQSKNGFGIQCFLFSK